MIREFSSKLFIKGVLILNGLFKLNLEISNG
jgi:hypothetical protein